MSASSALTHEQDRIDLQASEWVVLASDRDLSELEQRALEEWLAVDGRHQAAWQEMSRTWATIPALTDLSSLVVFEAAPDNRQKGLPPRSMVKGAVAVFAAMAAVFVGVFFVPVFWPASQRYETGIAQTQLLTLEDNSQVTLGPKSILTVKFSKDERRVTLSGGEAFFEVAHNKARPFYVEAGGSLTRVVGTKFDVNYGAGSVRVAVLEGLVQVSRPGPVTSRPPAVRFLRPGQRAEIMLAIASAISVSDSAQNADSALRAQAPGAWREGRLVYEDVRLADLVADVNRYYAPGVSVADDSVRNLRVTASFKASEIPAFMGAVGNVVPVKATETAGGGFRLEAADQ